MKLHTVRQQVMFSILEGLFTAVCLLSYFLLQYRVPSTAFAAQLTIGASSFSWVSLLFVLINVFWCVDMYRQYRALGVTFPAGAIPQAVSVLIAVVGLLASIAMQGISGGFVLTNNSTFFVGIVLLAQGVHRLLYQADEF